MSETKQEHITRFGNAYPLISKIVFITAAAACLTPWLTPPIALLIGLILAQTTGHPYRQYNHKATQILLQVSVVGLGFGMNCITAINAGKEGIIFSAISILTTLLLGYGLGRLFKIDPKTSHLISSGTAICGGSAIAAISKVLNTEEKQTSVALGTVFILNSIALFIFPLIGHALNLSQHQFGIWAAIAIHDTSSVVGASSKYGAEALQTATTVKLVRALWIVPLAIATSIIFRQRPAKVKIPFFIIYFIIAMIVGTYVPFIAPAIPYLTMAAKAGLTLTLFLIGAGSSYTMLKSVGYKPLLQGVILWIFISVTALWAVESILK
ncbi:MAG TPA: putative sulfate exporter family transporter [Bacteroidia bacterium]|jgi:uncharacterized integral membrane protein (TIGR00698 family)|nr:putative sulfate exporter family transporter [Bacteroidia bacterium]